ESMITVAGDIQYSLAQHRLVLMRRQEHGPALQNFGQHVLKMRRVISGIIAYSIEIVTLAEAPTSGKERAAALADYLEGLRRPVVAEPIPDLHLTSAQIDKIIQNVRSQKNLLAALGAAQPLIDEVARVASELTDDSAELLDKASDEHLRTWDEEYKAVIWADEEIRDAQVENMRGLYFLREYIRGNEAALDSLYTTDPLMERLFPRKSAEDIETVLGLQGRLIYKLEKLNEMRNQFHPSMELYWKGLMELDDAKAAYKGAFRKARNAVLLWSRAHRALAAGVTDPAQIDIMGLMLKTAQKVLPIPGL
ncbi:MAG: hypothetical protein WBH55_02765, partial [Bacteroidota bacterium]